MTRRQRIALAMYNKRPVETTGLAVYRDGRLVHLIPNGPPRWINGRDAFTASYGPVVGFGSA